MLKPVAPEVWTAESFVTMPGGTHLPARMTVIRLPDGALLLHSPVTLDDALAAEISALGPVAHIVAPNLFHHLFVTGALARFPGSTLHVAPGLGTKRPDLAGGTELGDAAPAAWQGVLETAMVHGAPKINEVVLFHRPTRTLIATDLLFNIREPKGLGAGIVLRIMGTYKRYARSRMWNFYTKDRRAAGASVARMMTWDFERVLVAHGDPVVEGAHGATQAALATMLEPA